MKTAMRMENAVRRRARTPGWLLLGLMGLWTMLLAQWAPHEAGVVIVIIGGVMTVSAVFWARFWVSHRLLGSRRLIPATKKPGQRQ